jgi:hypothetical protein
MKQYRVKKHTAIVRLCALATVLVVASFFLFSFTVNRYYANEFLKQLGITKATADNKMNSGFLLGSFDEYGLSKAKSIAAGNRAAIVKDVVAYAKKHVTSEMFIRQYNEMRNNGRPAASTLQTPEEMQKELIENARKNLAEAEANYKKADASLKPVFETVLKEAKKQKAEAENPNNKMLSSYRKNYAAGVKNAEESNKRLMAEWEAKYPANHMLYIKIKLQQFLDDTKDIDFNAELVSKNDKKIFVNKAYESKGNRWKMAFRAGKETIETGRTLVQQWITEIK